MVPAVDGAPSLSILINPVPFGPAAPSHTGNSTPVPVTPVHTGTEVKQADSIVTTSLPVADVPPLQDFIYWQPDATGTGVEPIYVMLSSLPKSVNHKHKHYPLKVYPGRILLMQQLMEGVLNSNQMLILLKSISTHGKMGK
jgi:hypothetical protein